MSSHHIVREKQEPALLILGLENFSFEQLGQLLEWSPTVITIPSVAEELNSLGLKIDWIIGDDAGEIIQSDIKILPAGSAHPIDVALLFLIKNGYPSVNIVTDDFELANFLRYITKINIVVFYNQQKIYAVTPLFKKWKPAGEKIELLTSADDLSFEGLQNIAPNKYVTSSDGFFSLSFDGDFLFIAEEI